MKRQIITLLFILLSTTILFAQRDDHFERIQALKVSHISERVELTPEQAKAFWPIYDKYENERKELRRKHVQDYIKKNPEANRREATNMVGANIDFQEQQLALKKKFINSLKGKISDDQIDKVFIAEQEFRKMLLRRLNNNRKGRPGRR